MAKTKLRHSLVVDSDFTSEDELEYRLLIHIDEDHPPEPIKKDQILKSNDNLKWELEDLSSIKIINPIQGTEIGVKIYAGSIISDEEGKYIIDYTIVNFENTPVITTQVIYDGLSNDIIISKLNNDYTNTSVSGETLSMVNDNLIGDYKYELLPFTKINFTVIGI